MEQSGTIETASFAYDTKLDRLKVSDLQPDDFLHLKTKRGTRYVFRVFMKEGDKIFIKCEYGRPILEDSTGQLRNDSLEKNIPLIYGKSEGLNQTSSLREIIVSRNGEPKAAQKQYETEVNETDSSTLEPGDYIKINTRNSIYIFKVISIDSAIGLPFIKTVGGNSRFLGKKGRLLSAVIETGYSLHTEFVDTSRLEKLVISRNFDKESVDPPNPFDTLETSMPHKKIDESPDVSRRTESPYYTTEQEVIASLGIEDETLNRPTVETAWLYFEHIFEKHMQTLGIVERIQENLRYERLKMGYKALMERLKE
jgi:hypothetical protein